MSKRPNVLWLMSDQHNAGCTGYANHPNVKTPNLDSIAADGVEFTNAFCNNPICSPSRVSFFTGQYMHTHRMFGNDHSEYPNPNPDTLACLFRRYGYQAGLFGKSHMTRRWDEDAFERIRYVDLTDAKRGDPRTVHYFDYLVAHGLADLYEDGSAKDGQEYTLDGSGPAHLPYEHSLERFTSNETLKFLEERDESRPFFVHMSFERPHAPIAPAAEHFDMYDPEDMVLPDSACDWFESGFAGKPEFMRKTLEGGHDYPQADPDPNRLKRTLASYYALITVIDMEIGRVLKKLDEMGELENTVIFYTADHGDFAGEHGLFHKNFGLYESIHRIPFLLKWPGGPKGAKCAEIVESIDFYPTLCELCNIPMPEGREGISLVDVAKGTSTGKDAAFIEWEWIEHGRKISGIRTKEFRLSYYGGKEGGELYDRRVDPGETRNLWDNPEYAPDRLRLTEQLMDFTLKYSVETGNLTDFALNEETQNCPTRLIHKGKRYWSDLKESWEKPTSWPPKTD